MSLTTPVKVDLGEDENKALDNYVYDNLIALKNSYSTLHTDKLDKWRRLTKGRPKEESRSFPWPNASNVVVQVIGENVDTIKAIQLGSIYEILPLWPVGLLGDWKEDEHAEEQRSIVERYMDEMGLSRGELDLYRVESKAAHDIAALGSVVIKLPYVVQKEAIVIGSDISSAMDVEDKVMYEGPRPEKLAYEDWAATPTAQTWEEADFKFHYYTLKKHECCQKAAEGAFDKEVWASLENSPDQDGLTESDIKKLEAQNISGPMDGGRNLAIWKFYECWLKYWHKGKKYSICYTMHLQTKKRMNAFFNFYPNNEEPFEFGRLGYSEDGLLGYGFAEMGEMLQEEISTGHNQRVDNRTLANTSVLLGGKNARMDAGISLFPMAVLPFNKDEVDIVQLGSNYPSSVQEEELSLALAKARFGTDMPGAEGNGSGTVNKKGGYSSMGTFSIMQQGARRININVTDFRYLHLNIGRKCLKQYATFGISTEKLNKYGEGSKYLEQALKNVNAGRLEFPIKAATASINKEIEKQTGMLFTQVMQRHYGAIAQILQGVTNPVIPAEIKEFLMGSIGGMSVVMEKLLRAFGYDDIYRLQPEKNIIEAMKKQQQQQAQQQQQQQAQQKGAGQNGQQNVSGNAGASPASDGGQGIQQVALQSANSGAVSK